MIALILAVLLLGEIEPPPAGSLSSSNASFDGSALTLTGHVKLDHGLGKMQAEEATLEKQEAGKDFPFSLIRLKKAVEFALSESASLVCNAATLDFTTLEGNLTASEEEPLIYRNTFKRKDREVPLELRSRRADLTFLSKNGPAGKNKYAIKTLEAKESVSVRYGNDFELLAGSALYQEEGGSISALPPEGGACEVLHGLDKVEATQVHLDLHHSQIQMSAPQGSLSSSLLPSSESPLTFSATHLNWDQGKNLLTLTGNVVVMEPSLGKISTDEELILSQKGGHLASLQTRGPSVIHYANSHFLKTSGPLKLDTEKLQVLAGKEPLYYREDEFALLADKAQFEYSMGEGALKPASLSLTGHVRLFSHDPQKPKRCAAADRVTYSPTTRTFILGADPGKKVLFINEEEGIRVSAQEVHVTEDAVSKKQTVKGIGLVQLSFTAEEEALMQKLFKLIKEVP